MNVAVLISLVAGAVTWLVMHIDARISDSPKSNFEYFKGVAWTMVLVFSIIKLCGPNNFKLLDTTNIVIPNPISNIATSGAEMLTGPAPF